MLRAVYCLLFFFFFNDTATTEIYTLSLHDALPIYPENSLAAVPWRRRAVDRRGAWWLAPVGRPADAARLARDRKSTRLNSSHVRISYAVFCLKKKHQPSRRPQTVPQPTGNVPAR